MKLSLLRRRSTGQGRQRENNDPVDQRKTLFPNENEATPALDDIRILDGKNKLSTGEKADGVVEESIPRGTTSNEGIMTPSFISSAKREFNSSENSFDMSEETTFSLESSENQDHRGCIGSMCLNSWDLDAKMEDDMDDMVFSDNEIIMLRKAQEARQESSSIFPDIAVREGDEKDHREASLNDSDFLNVVLPTNARESTNDENRQASSSTNDDFENFRATGWGCMNSFFKRNQDSEDAVEVLGENVDGDASMLTTPSFLHARLIAANDGHERNVLRHGLNDNDETATLTPTSIIQDQGSDQPFIKETDEEGTEQLRNSSQVSTLTSSLDDIYIVLSCQPKTCCEHCRQPFSFAETRVTDFCGSKAANVRGMFHTFCRLIRVEVKKQRKLVLRQITLFGYLKRLRVLEARQRARSAKHGALLRKQREEGGGEKPSPCQEKKRLFSSHRKQTSGIPDQKKSLRRGSLNGRYRHASSVERKSRPKVPSKMKPGPPRLSVQSRMSPRRNRLLRSFTGHVSSLSTKKAPMSPGGKSGPNVDQLVQDEYSRRHGRSSSPKRTVVRASERQPTRHESRKGRKKKSGTKLLTSSSLVKPLSSDVDALYMPTKSTNGHKGADYHQRISSLNKFKPDNDREKATSRSPKSNKLRLATGTRRLLTRE